MWQLKNLNHRTILNYMGKTKITKEIINFSKNSLVSSLETTQKEKERTFYSNKFNSASKYPVPCLILSWILKWILLHFLAIQTTFYWIPTYKLTYIQENFGVVNKFLFPACVSCAVCTNQPQPWYLMSIICAHKLCTIHGIHLDAGQPWGWGVVRDPTFRGCLGFWLIWISAGM